jgi:chromosome segregation ATPase
MIVSPDETFPFDDKNQQDFVEVTGRIQTALEQMKSDQRLKRTESNLAKLAQCSRGTLRNRVWPIQELKKLKAQTKAKIEDAEEVAEVKEVSRIERYKEQLAKSRDEVMNWKFKHDDLAQRLETVQAQSKAHKDRAERLDARVRELERRLRGDGDESNVVPFKP